MALKSLISNINETISAIKSLPVAHRLDTGRGETHEFGYRIPIPLIEAEPNRTLRIFRRYY